MSNLEELIEKLCPDGVEYKTLGELGKFYGGLTGKSKEDFKEGNAKFITYKNVYSNPALDLDVEDRVRIYPDENQRILEYGDVIFTGSSETPDECGFASVLTKKTDEKLYLNSFCFIFRFNDVSVMLPDFSKHLFRCNFLRYQIGKTASGVTRFNVSKKLMAKVKLPVPPLEVQREIVRILDNFTFLTTELAAELAARPKQYEYYRNSLLTFEDIQKSMIKSIPWVKLDNIIEFKNGKGHEKCINENGQYIVVNSKFISTNGRVKKFSDQQLSPLYNNDILMVMSDLPNGQALAKTYLVKENSLYTLNQRICALTVKNKNYSTKFLFYYLNRNKQLLKYDNGVDQTNLKKGDILTVIVPVISLAEQQRIVDILDRFDALCNDISSGLPAEIEARQKQYEYYRDKLLTFKELKKEA